ncbi:uncharacterized protein K460DRAFT_354247 [Cucurbitaria berberidis CBS 394.84]|uniref:Uncharacterized protein n=1 Tax=Cucurbitaria berberidis CBS 394.84 TaxID=1168544 RepID=A0A9P4LBT9_9PLEO|nr:uncharacterized protein K460DRAFT_354247 [Cucurbitaria berberidis CBS 394.84]KAF1849395.1 hypothetical protein K460DRAFT_354247 [Cucurbitaria berberidis CBS 394.84]
MPASLNLSSSGSNDYKFIIDLPTPSSTAACTPTMGEFDVEPAAEDNDALEAQPSKEREQAPQPLGAKQTVSSLLAVLASQAQQNSVFSSESSIINYMYSNAITPADVEVLIPAMINNFNIMDKLALNIGWNHFRGYISEIEIDQILAHILAKGDYQNLMFEATKAQIELHRPRHHPRDANAKAKEHAKKAARESQNRRKNMPAIYKQPSVAGTLPYGCTTLADVYADVYGMTWSQVLQISDRTKASSKGKIKIKMNKSGSLNSSSAASAPSFFSQTRLHNGPGLTDKRKPIVRLPQAQDLAKVESKKAETEKVESKKVKSKKADYDFLWAKTRSSPDLLGRKKCEVIVVKLPPQN